MPVIVCYLFLAFVGWINRWTPPLILWVLPILGYSIGFFISFLIVMQQKMFPKNKKGERYVNSN